MPKVSVIIPVYTVEEYLPRCLNSLLNQTLKDIEIICIDDCSKDSSLEVLNKYAMQDDRIKVVSLKENKGAAFARNKGLEIAKGEYLGFVDPDDYVDLDFYEKLYKKALVDGADIVKAELKTKYPDGLCLKSNMNNAIEKSGNKFAFTHEWTCAIYKTLPIKECGVVFPSDCRKGQDSVFLNRALLCAKKTNLIFDTYYYYVRRDGSLDSSVLSDLAASSIVKCTDINISELTKAYSEKKITKDEYIVGYIARLNLYVYTFLQTSSIDAENLCVNKLFEKYASFLFKEAFKCNFAYGYVSDFIANNDKKGASQCLKSKKTEQQKIKLVSPLEILRKNIKRKNNG